MGVNAGRFFDHVDAFMNYRKTVYAVSLQTLQSNRVDLSLFERFIRSGPYKAIDGPAVMAFQYHLKTERENSGGSINRKIHTLRSYSHFLRLQEMPKAEKLPFYDVLKIRQGYRNRPGALTLDQVRSFFTAIDRQTIMGLRDYAVYALMYLTGLRVGEVFALDLDAIDIKRKTLEVVGKGNKRRTMHLTGDLSQVLCEWIAVRPNFLNSDTNNALFLSKKGNRLAIRTMEDNFKKVLSRTAIRAHFNVTCHTLRHSFASHLNDKDVDILVIQSLMGHASARSTEPYIHPSIDKTRAALEKLPGVIFLKDLIARGHLKLKFYHNQPKKE